MRRLVALLIALVLAVGVTWSVAAAQDDTPVQVCIRSGFGVRAPDSRGRCPIGFTRTDLERYAADQPTPVVVAESIDVNPGAGEPWPVPGGGIGRFLCLAEGAPEFDELQVAVSGVPGLDGARILVESAWGGTESRLGSTSGSTPTSDLLAVAGGPNEGNDGSWRVSIALTDGRVLTLDGLTVADDAGSVCEPTHVRMTLTP